MTVAGAPFGERSPRLALGRGVPLPNLSPAAPAGADEGAARQERPIHKTWLAEIKRPMDESQARAQGEVGIGGKRLPSGTKGERAASGRFAEGESEPEVASLTSTGHGSGLRVDQAGGAEGSRVAASDPQMGSLTSVGCDSSPRADQTAGAGGRSPIPKGGRADAPTRRRADAAEPLSCQILRCRASHPKGEGWEGDRNLFPKGASAPQEG